MDVLLLVGLSINETGLGVNSGTISICCMSFERPEMRGFVH